MSDVVGEVDSLALVVAASPFTIIPAILLLFTPLARATSASFLVGWVLALAACVAVFALLATVIEIAEGTPTWASWGRVVLGLALIGLGVRQWLRRNVPKPAPAWMRSIESAGPGKAFVLALVLAIANPKILLLSAAAGLAIGAAELPDTGTAVAIAVFTAVGAVSVAVPVVLYAVLGDRVLGPLGRARDWLEANNALVMSIVILAIGLALVVKGVSAL